jgi:hypothetical protein
MSQNVIAMVLNREHIDLDRTERILNLPLVGKHAFVTPIECRADASRTKARAPLDLRIEVPQNAVDVPSIPGLISPPDGLDVLRHSPSIALGSKGARSGFPLDS